MRHLILVVEEDPILGELLSTALEGEGYTPHLVSEREQALQGIETLLPSLILLDYCAFSDEILQSVQGRAIPIIMLSSVEASLQVNGGQTSRKPFDLNNLLSLVASALPPAAED